MGGTTERHADSIQLARQWSILRLLSQPGRTYSVKELSEQLGASKSSIERDLATLERNFALVEEAEGKQKRRYRIDDRVKAIESIRFSLMELLALHAAYNMMVPSAGTPFHADLKELITKVRGALSSHQNHGLGAFGQVFQPHRRGVIDYSDRGELIDTLVDAVARRRVCRGRYRGGWSDQERAHVLRPLRLFSHDGALYVLAWTSAHRRVVTFAVHRFQSLEATGRTFRPPRVDLDALARQAFGVYSHEDNAQLVEILFSEAFAWKIEERVFHPDERKERLPDGRLRYRIRSSAKWEIVPWVLGFGGEAELVRPKEWRGEVLARGSALADRHRTKRHTR